MAKERKQIKLEGPIEDSNQSMGIGGLGDLVSAVTETFGIKPCGECQRRREEFNRNFPWIKASREITEEEHTFMAEKINSTHTIDSDSVNKLFALYNDLFQSKLQRCNCPGLISRMIERINVFLVK